MLIATRRNYMDPRLSLTKGVRKQLNEKDKMIMVKQRPIPNL